MPNAGNVTNNKINGTVNLERNTFTPISLVQGGKFVMQTTYTLIDSIITHGSAETTTILPMLIFPA